MEQYHQHGGSSDYQFLHLCESRKFQGFRQAQNFFGFLVFCLVGAGRLEFIVDAAADNLLVLAAKIDTDKRKAPAALTVITGNGFAYRRPDGVNVVPLSTLTK